MADATIILAFAERGIKRVEATAMNIVEYFAMRKREVEGAAGSHLSALGRLVSPVDPLGDVKRIGRRRIFPDQMAALEQGVSAIR
jgi:hypothetical protein